MCLHCYASASAAPLKKHLGPTAPSRLYVHAFVGTGAGTARATAQKAATTAVMEMNCMAKVEWVVDEGWAVGYRNVSGSSRMCMRFEN